MCSSTINKMPARGDPMTQNTVLPDYTESVQVDLKDLLVAYDLSAAADSSLKYAVMLSKLFGSFIHLIGVQSPAEYLSALEGGPLAMQLSQRDLQSGLREVEERLRAQGIGSDSVRRIGNISDTIEGAVLEHMPDLLLLGAYGYGAIDRPRLGSTAEHLLRTVRCAAFIVGPKAILRHQQAPAVERILCPVSTLDVTDHVYSFAGRFTRQVGAQLEIVYAMDPTRTNVRDKYNEQRCEQWCRQMRDRGVIVTWNVLHGRAEQLIARRATESNASLVLFGLHRSGNQMIDCPDGVVSATIRQVPCPVMTVPPLPH